MENYRVTHLLKKMTELIKDKINIVSIYNNSLKETVICIIFSAITSTIAIISFQLFKQYKHRIMKQRRIISNQFKLRRQLIVLYNRFTKNLNYNPSDEILYKDNLCEDSKAYNYAMLWSNYQRNRKLCEMNNLNTFCMLKFNIQLQGKSHFIIKNSGMMIGAFNKFATSMLLR